VVEGEVVGSLKTEKTLRVGQGAKVSADVKAHTAYIAGEVKGNLNVQDRIELSESARVDGDLSAKTISIQAGAQFNGRCTMAEAGKPVVTATPPKPVVEEKKEEDNE
jgi:cytoskeletal protein CcmA (bactofilin family)